MRPPKIIEVPFDELGNQLAYPISSWRRIPDHPKANSQGWVTLGCVMEQNFEFDATLEFEEISTGRSAVRFHFVDVNTGKKYVMFLTDAQDIIKKLEKGKISGRWTFCKKGANFGVKLVENEDQF